MFWPWVWETTLFNWVLVNRNNKSSPLCRIDAVGSSQIILHMPNLERTRQFDKESEAVLWFLKGEKCAGPQEVPKSRFSKMLFCKIWTKKWNQILENKHNVGFKNIFTFFFISYKKSFWFSHWKTLITLIFLPKDVSAMSCTWFIDNFLLLRTRTLFILQTFQKRFLFFIKIVRTS